MSLYNLTGPPKIRRIDGYIFSLPYPSKDNFMSGAMVSESQYRDMATHAKKKAGEKDLRPTFRFELCALDGSLASDIAYTLHSGEFYFTPRTKVGADTGEEMEYLVRSSSSLNISRPVYEQQAGAIRMQIELESVEGSLIIDSPKPTHLYMGDAAGDIWRVQMLGNPPWTRTKIASITPGRTFNRGKVSQLEGYIITIENIPSDSVKVMRRNIDGSNLQELISFPDSGAVSVTDMCMDHVRKRFVINEDVTPGYDLRAYDFDGVLNETIFSSGAGDGKHPAISPSGAYLSYRYRRTGIPDVNDQQLVVLDTLSNDPIYDWLASGFTGVWSVMDDTHIYTYDALDDNIKTLSYPAGIPGATISPGFFAGDGISILREEGRLLFSVSLGKLHWIRTDGTDLAEIVPASVPASRIEWISTGFD